MKITFHRTGYFYVTFNGYEKKMFKSLDEAVNYISDNFTEGNTETWEIIDLDTDEVIMTFEDEDPSEDNDWGYNEDMGFDPYMGCYTDEC